VRRKHAEKTHSCLWGQSTILISVWDVGAIFTFGDFELMKHSCACLTWRNFRMSELQGSFPKCMWVRRKHAEKTRSCLWGQSTILILVWDVGAIFTFGDFELMEHSCACLTWRNFRMSELQGNFPKCMWVRRKHAKKTRSCLWDQSTILISVWDVTCWIRLQLISKRCLYFYGNVSLCQKFRFMLASLS